jgi:hypothetical protein
MTKPIYATRTLIACPDTVLGVNYDLDYFASNVTGAIWTLTTSTITNDMAHQVSIRNDAAVDHSGKTALITGFYGIYPITETVTLPGASLTVKSTKYFTSITSIVPSATIGADTMDIGICEISITTLLKNNWHGDNQGICITLVSGVTEIDYTVQFTRSRIEPLRYDHRTNCYTGLYDQWNWFNFDDTDAVNATTSLSLNIQECPTGLRGLINSYTANTTPVIDVEITQVDVK